MINTLLSVIAIMACTCAFVYPIAHNRGVDRACSIYETLVVNDVMTVLIDAKNSCTDAKTIELLDNALDEIVNKLKG